MSAVQNICNSSRLFSQMADKNGKMEGEIRNRSARLQSGHAAAIQQSWEENTYERKRALP